MIIFNLWTPVPATKRLSFFYNKIINGVSNRTKNDMAWSVGSKCNNDTQLFYWLSFTAYKHWICHRFLLYQNFEVYLITNRHVVINEKKEFFPDHLVIRVHTSETNLLPNRDISIPLYDNQIPLWREHPNINNVCLFIFVKN